MVTPIYAVPRYTIPEKVNAHARASEAASDAEALRQFKTDRFQALAHPTCSAMVAMLRGNEVSMRTVCERFGMKQTNTSWHLTVLRAWRIVVNRKEGRQVFHSLRRHQVVVVQDAMRLYFEAHLSETMEMLEEIKLHLPTSTVSPGTRK